MKKTTETNIIQPNIFDEYDDRMKFKLENFEGPLDLLLYLIKDKKMEIKDVKLADITKQYLSYLADLKNIDMEKASEFIEIAAILLEIKSKSLLPKPEEIKAPDEEDAEMKLKQKLEEYKLFKEATENLKPLEEIGKFYKAPEVDTNNYKVVLKDFSYDKLLDAFSKMLLRVGEKSETVVTSAKQILLDRWTITDKISIIKKALTSEGKVKFSRLFSEDRIKSEVITTFLAILELLKREQIKVVQEEQFGEIDIEKNENFESDVQISLEEEYN